MYVGIRSSVLYFMRKSKKDTPFLAVTVRHMYVGIRSTVYILSKITKKDVDFYRRK